MVGCAVMNPDTGAVYGSLDEAFGAGEQREDLVELVGSRRSVETLVRNYRPPKRQKDARRAKRKMARASRRRNR